MPEKRGLLKSSCAILDPTLHLYVSLLAIERLQIKFWNNFYTLWEGLIFVIKSGRCA